MPIEEKPQQEALSALQFTENNEINDAQLWQKTANFLGFLQDYCNQEARRERRADMAQQLRKEIEQKEREIDRLYGAEKSDRY